MRLEKFHEDERGIIWKLKVTDKIVYNIIETRAGFMRSGDIHPNNQHDIILKGKVNIMERHPSSKTEGFVDKLYELEETDHLIIEKDIPHTFKSVTDSVVLEFWDGPFSCEYHKELRSHVDSVNAELLKPKTL